MNIEYNIVKKADRKQIIELYKDAGWWTNKDDADTSFVDAIVEGTYLFAVAIEKNRIIGMGRAISDGVSDAYIQDVVVCKTHRKKGVGGEIIKLLVDRLRSNNIGWIGLISEPGAENFYLNLGFEVMERHTPYIYRNKN